jgi:protoheme ferro-lyase
MELMRYFLLAFLFLGFGYSYVMFLTVHPLKMSRFLLIAVSVFTTGIFLLVTGFQGVALVIGCALALLSTISTYLFTTRRVLSREEPHPLPQISRHNEDAGNGHTAVIYFTHGEPETYDPIGWINQFREFDEQKIPFIPLAARPYFLHSLRKKYLVVGRSEHRSIHQRMIHLLAEEYCKSGDHSTRFYLSFLDDNPRPDAAVIQALNEGASRIVVAEVFLTTSNHTAEGKHQIQSILDQFPDIPVSYTGPMHDSLRLQEMFISRVNHHNGTVDKSKIGILLVGHGQPDEWDQNWPTETEQEIKFRLDVLKKLEQDGYLRENMSLAWMEFKEPKPARKVEEFFKKGVEKILYFPAAISADSLHSQFDIPELIHKAKVPADFQMVNLGAWNDDPMVIQAIKEKCDLALLQDRSR